MNASTEPTETPVHTHTAAVQRLVNYFENLSPQSVDQLASLYAPNARFKDPFNEVNGIAAIQGVFAHMFVALSKPRFVITKQILQGEDCFLTWEFRFAFKTYQPGIEQVILGATHVVFSPNGQVCLHRDYWDAAQELYEKLPLVGALMRWLKKRVNS
jgi:steroid Delta-isomerase